jgi:hypothetical protein
MRTSTKGIEMQASAMITFKFVIGGRTFTQERGISMEEYIRDPWEYGNTLRSAWFAARDDAASAAKKITSSHPGPWAI